MRTGSSQSDEKASGCDDMASTKSTLVSIIFPTLNAGTHLRAALDSCLNQSYHDLEVLVIDGGSTDDTLQILESYSDPRLHVFHQTDNSGKLPGALNLGFAQSSGAYLTWMQA